MIVGIDPGFSGGVAVLNNEGGWIGGMRMPVLSIHKREVIDCTRLNTFLWRWNVNAPRTYVIEAVHSMPKQGVASTFKFGRAAGAVEAWVLCNGGRPHFVSPRKWKGDLGLTSDKRDALKMAAEKWPDAGVKWNVLRNDGIAEAALIAWHHLNY